MNDPFVMMSAFSRTRNMVQPMYPFWSAMLAMLIAQLTKPIFHWFFKHEWRPGMVHDSGGFPSSHSAMVSALAMSVGLRERFSSTLFAISLTMALIVIYDAANVRYYSGQNIRLTKQLAKDVQEQLNTEFMNPIYDTKMKDVLGHKWAEIMSGILIGVTVALLFHVAG